MKQQFTINKKNLIKLAEKFKAYDLAVLGYDLQEERCKEIYKKVLAENEFFAHYGYSPNVKVGDRITNEKDDWLLSKEDFDRLIALARPIFVAEGITDENDYFVTNWIELKSSTRQELVDFIINEIAPINTREVFRRIRTNFVKTEKLIETVRPLA